MSHRDIVVAPGRHSYRCAAGGETILFRLRAALLPDVGFRFDSERDGGRLSWLPNVRGQK
jgi:hypothetical protein